MMNRRRRIHALLLGAACVSLLASADIARSQGTSVPTMTVAQFTANPASLLAQSRNLAGDVAMLLGADHNALAALVGLLPTASPNQQRAMINGLAQVAVGLQTTDPAFAQSIQQAVAQTGNQELITAFATQIGGVAIGAAGGGGGGGTGGGGPTGGGAAGGGPNASPFVAGNASTSNTGTNLLTGGTVPATTGGGTTTTLSAPVSQP
jgi:hypothetical protein